MQITPATLPATAVTDIHDGQDLNASLKSALGGLTDDMIATRNNIDAFMQTPNALSNPKALASFQVEMANYSVNNALISGVTKRLTTGIETLVKG